MTTINWVSGITWTVVRISRFSPSSAWTEEQRLADSSLLWSQQRWLSHIFAIWRSFLFVSDNRSSPVEGSLWIFTPWIVFMAHWCLWIPLCSYTHKKYDVEKHCVCERVCASIIQHGRCALLFLPPAGWPGGQHSWDKAGLFCSHDVMANKAPWWNWLPTITLDIDDVTHPRQPRLLQGQRGHERAVMKVVGEVAFVSHFICTDLPPLLQWQQRCLLCLLFHIGGSLQ